jgi:uncharacterized membrane protein
MLASISQAIPLFFAGVIFAITFSQTKSIENALGSNLIGSVLGGIIESASLVFGIRSLYLFAMAFYLLSVPALRQIAARHPIHSISSQASPYESRIAKMSPP